MASANHDANSVRLSRLIDDPVTTATTDGNEVTSLLRNDYLNKANRFIQLTLLSLGGDHNRKDIVERFIPGLKKTLAITTWSSAGFALASDYQFWLECTHDTASVLLTWHPSKPELDLALDSNKPDAFTISAGKIYGYYAGVILNAGAGTLWYVQNDQRASAADTADIAIDSMWFDPLVDLAASFYYEDKGESGAGHLQRLNIILGSLKGI